jgi:hypothetical protein
MAWWWICYKPKHIADYLKYAAVFNGNIMVFLLLQQSGDSLALNPLKTKRICFT